MREIRFSGLGMATAALIALQAASPSLAAPRRAPSAKAAAPAALAAPAVVEPSASDWRTVSPDDLLVIDTNRGRILVELVAAAAPGHVERIRTLAKQHFYDGQTFFRVIDGFMDQTGDPTNTGEGGSSLPDLKAEFDFRRGPETPVVVVAKPAGLETGFLGVLPVVSQPSALMALRADGKVTAWGAFCPGVAGMARASEPDSANSQFFLMREAYPSLEHKYTAFGRVLAGQEVVRAIKVGEPVPPPQDRMLTVRLASDLPPEQRPKVQVLDTASAAFRSLVERTRAERGADFSVCDVALPVKQGG